MQTEIYYTCVGSIRGKCGHAHRTIENAEKCCADDQSACKRQGGYSDRNIRVIENGVVRQLTESESEYLYRIK